MDFECALALFTATELSRLSGSLHNKSVNTFSPSPGLQDSTTLGLEELGHRTSITMAPAERRKESRHLRVAGANKIGFLFGQFYELLQCSFTGRPNGCIATSPSHPAIQTPTTTHMVVMLALCGYRSIKCTSFGTFMVGCRPECGLKYSFSSASKGGK